MPSSVGPLHVTTMADRRRLLGPSDTRYPVFPAQASHDKPSGIRKFFVGTGLSKNANGLAYLEVEDTVIEVSIFGPRPIRGLFIERASFSVECKFSPYLTQPNEVLFNSADRQMGRTSLTNVEHKLSTFVETAFLPAVLLEKYPKSTIDVFVTVVAFNSKMYSLQNLASWVVNCTTMALVDSGVEIRDMVTCGHVLLQDDEVVADPQADERTECVALFMTMKNNEMVAFWVDGGEALLETTLEQLLGGCLLMAHDIRHNLNGVLLKAQPVE